MGKHNDFGKEGEEIAATFLLKNGYTIRHKNYRYLKAEVDIIAEKNGTLAIIEVRARRSNYLENIADTVTAKKIKLLVAAADYYVVSNDLEVDIRFDIITVLKNSTIFELEHLENAFYHF